MERKRESHAPPSLEIERRWRCLCPAYAGGGEGEKREAPHCGCRGGERER
jgi:hypothetical protein